jgi:hypothetical protein
MMSIETGTPSIHLTNTMLQLGNELINLDHVVRIALEDDEINLYTIEQVSDSRGMFGNRKHTIPNPGMEVVNILFNGIPGSIDAREVLNMRIIVLG